MVKTINALQKFYYHWRSIFVELSIHDCHLNVHLLLDTSVQKYTIVVEFPVLNVVFRRSCQDHMDALKSANWNERPIEGIGGYLPPSYTDDASLR